MKKLKIIIDVLMYILFIILMGPHITDNLIHEILGITIFLFFIVHNILNYKWYKILPRGKYNRKRSIILLIDITLLINMIGIIISSVIISSEIFTFLSIPTTIFGRKLHMLSTSWGFVLMSIHLGMHLNIIMKKISKKMKKSSFEYVYYVILFIIVFNGIYSFIKLNLISDMFLLNAFKYYNYNEHLIMFYQRVLSSSLLIALIVYFINNLKMKRKKEIK